MSLFIVDSAALPLVPLSMAPLSIATVQPPSMRLPTGEVPTLSQDSPPSTAQGRGIIIGLLALSAIPGLLYALAWMGGL